MTDSIFSRYRDEHPILMGILLMFAFAVFSVLFYILFSRFIQDRLTADASSTIFCLISSVAFTFLSGKSDIFVEKTRGAGYALRCGGALVLLDLYLLATSFVSARGLSPAPKSHWVWFVVFALFSGFAEEFVFRGAILGIFNDFYGDRRSGVWRAILFTNVLYALYQFKDVRTVSALGSLVPQALFALIFGMALSGIYLRSRNIMSCALLHTLYLLCSNVIPGVFQSDQNVSFHPQGIACFAVTLVVSVFLLRGHRMKQVIHLNRQAWMS